MLAQTARLEGLRQGCCSSPSIEAQSEVIITHTRFTLKSVRNGQRFDEAGCLLPRTRCDQYEHT